MSDRFAEIMDRQLETDREGEAERQACDKRGAKGEGRKGKGKDGKQKRSIRKRMQARGMR